MIQFSCPTCQAVLSAEPDQAGTKVACPSCQQRIRVPQPEQNQTVVGRIMAQMPIMPGQAGGSPAAFASGPAPMAPPPIPAGGFTHQKSATTETSPQLKVAEWFYTQAGRQAGPVPWAELRFMASSGRLHSNERVWTQGMASWVPVGSIQGLAPSGAGAARRHAGGPRSAGGSAAKWWVIGGVSVTAIIAAVVLIVVLVSGGETGGRKELDDDDDGRELSTKQIVRKVSKSIGHIKTPLGSGTGFMVRPGVMATNAHVVEFATANQIKVTFPSAGEDGKKPIIVDQVLFFDRARDLALVKLDAKWSPLSLAENHKFQSGEKVTAIGNPGTTLTDESLENAVSEGVLSTKAKVRGQEYYQLSIAINPGNSGGPIFDSRGRVIGVATLRDPLKQGLGFCIPVQDVVNGIDKIKDQSEDANKKITSDYNAQVVFRRAARAGRFCVFGSNQIIKFWAGEMRAGRMVILDQLNFERDKFKKLLRENGIGHRMITSDLADIVPKVATDPLIASDTKSKLADLWSTYESLSANFERPGGNLNDYANTLKSNTTKLNQLVSSLRILLGIKEKDL